GWDGPGISDHRDRLERSTTPGQNKYFCGNLQIIMRFCETPNRTIAQFTGHLRGTEGYGLQPLRPLASPKQKLSCHLERGETESKHPRLFFGRKASAV